MILCCTAECAVGIAMLHDSETYWIDQRRIAELFGVDVQTVNEHLRKVYDCGERAEEATIRKSRILRTAAHREVSCYDVDTLIYDGCRVRRDLESETNSEVRTDAKAQRIAVKRLRKRREES